MSQAVTLNLPEHLASRAAEEAKRTSRPLEAVLLQWLERAGEQDVESLSDEEIETLCDSMMNADAQQELSDLLARNREAELDELDRRRLTELMAEYQEGLLRKARAWNVAVARGLKPALDE